MSNQQATCANGVLRYTRFVALMQAHYQTVSGILAALSDLPAPESLDTPEALSDLEGKLSGLASNLRNIERDFGNRADSGLMQYGAGVGGGVGLFGVLGNLALSEQVEAMRQTAQVRRQRFMEAAR